MQLGERRRGGAVTPHRCCSTPTRRDLRARRELGRRLRVQPQPARGRGARRERRAAQRLPSVHRPARRRRPPERHGAIPASDGARLLCSPTACAPRSSRQHQSGHQRRAAAAGDAGAAVRRAARRATTSRGRARCSTAGPAHVMFLDLADLEERGAATSRRSSCQPVPSSCRCWRRSACWCCTTVRGSAWSTWRAGPPRRSPRTRR